MIEIVPMAEEHINGVVTLEEATFSIPWTRADFEREVRENTMAIYYVALMDGRVVGYAGMWHVVTEGHITNVGVLEEVRCEGIGSRLMEKLIEKALEKEMTGITLEVRMGNRPAQALYHKYGFKAEGIRKNYYPDTKEDAIIMWKYFPDAEGASLCRSGKEKIETLRCESAFQRFLQKGDEEKWKNHLNWRIQS